MTRRIATLLAALVLAAPVAAQTTRASAAPAPALTDSVVTDTARLAAARDLLVALHIEEQMRIVQRGMLDAMAATAHPEIRKIIEDWVERYASFAAMRNDITQLYARTFTRDEMQQLTAFLRTPAGQHFASASGMLSQEGMKMGQRTAQAHTAELQEAIAAKVRELQGSPPAAKP